MITLVLTLSTSRFHDWRRRNGIGPRNRKARYVRDSQDLRGLGEPVEIVVESCFWLRPRAMDLYEDAQHVRDRNKDLPDPGPISR